MSPPAVSWPPAASWPSRQPSMTKPCRRAGATRCPRSARTAPRRPIAGRLGRVPRESNQTQWSSPLHSLRPPAWRTSRRRSPSRCLPPADTTIPSLMTKPLPQVGTSAPRSPPPQPVRSPRIARRNRPVREDRSTQEDRSAQHNRSARGHRRTRGNRRVRGIHRAQATRPAPAAHAIRAAWAATNNRSVLAFRAAATRSQPSARQRPRLREQSPQAARAPTMVRPVRLDR